MEMKIILKICLVSFITAIILTNLNIYGQMLSTKPRINESVFRESLAAIQRGVDYLCEHQAENGSWGGYGGHPAVTGLVCMALHNSQTKDKVEVRQQAVARGRKYILQFVQDDGSIWIKGREREYPNYTTSIALATLAILNHPGDEAVMRKARKYLIDSQIIDPKSKHFGGIGYGKSGKGESDLSNTQWALEALYLTEYLDREPVTENKDDKVKADLAWKNAVHFLSRLQNVPETNDMHWVVKDKNDPNYGGFVYKTNESKAGRVKKSLRSYGSMTYAGLKSMVYAKLKKDSPQVKAALGWAAKYYTLDENPGMGPQGHYYYLLTFAKTHAVLGDDYLKTATGKIAWRTALLKKFLNLQKGNGEWYNDQHGRWWESNPEMVTAYALISMEAALGPALAE